MGPHDEEEKQEKQGFPGQTEKGREEEVMSEIIERAIEANIKIHLGNEIATTKRTDGILEQMLQNAVNNGLNAQLAYQTTVNAANAEAVSFTQELHKQYLENNRFTLDRLYGMFPEESAGTTTLLKMIIDSLKAEGWTPPTPATK